MVRRALFVPNFARHCTAILIASIVTLSACANPAVEVEVRPGVEMSGYRKVGLAVVTPSEDVTGERGTLPIGELDRQARGLLADRGFEVVPFPSAQLILRIEPRIEATIRRGLSSDPDDAGTRAIQRRDVVLSIRAFDPAAKQEVWRSSARTSIPGLELDFVRSREDIWRDTLAAALGKLGHAPD